MVFGSYLHICTQLIMPYIQNKLLSNNNVECNQALIWTTTNVTHVWYFMFNVHENVLSMLREYGEQLGTWKRFVLKAF
jgi:hypothetical protein